MKNFVQQNVVQSSCYHPPPLFIKNWIEFQKRKKIQDFLKFGKNKKEIIENSGDGDLRQKGSHEGDMWTNHLKFIGNIQIRFLLWVVFLHITWHNFAKLE